jgi:hypothetical protein
VGPAYVVACVFKDEALGVFQIGFACRSNVIDAARKATAEALHLRRMALALMDPASALWQYEFQCHPADRSLLPFREDRKYAEHAGWHFNYLTKLPMQAQFYLDRRSWSRAWRKTLTSQTVSISELPNFSSGDWLEAACRSLVA